MMTKYEAGFMQKGFAAKMRMISKIDDSEEAHVRADELMCELLRQLGYNEGVDIYEKIEKWYS